MYAKKSSHCNHTGIQETTKEFKRHQKTMVHPLHCVPHFVAFICRQMDIGGQEDGQTHAKTCEDCDAWRNYQCWRSILINTQSCFCWKFCTCHEYQLMNASNLQRAWGEWYKPHRVLWPRWKISAFAVQHWGHVMPRAYLCVLGKFTGYI